MTLPNSEDYYNKDSPNIFVENQGEADVVQ